MESHVKFHSLNGKRLVLIVEDEAINREMLGFILKEHYELLFAATGEEALEAIRANFDTLSLILLDLNLPDMHGLEILRKIRENPHFSQIPIIVMTSDKESEVESLTVGASDFIPKPYPMPKVILARANRIIELSEDRNIIRWTERDHLTGLYNREYFYRYADQFDLFHKDMAMDAIVLDINHFHMINERYGKAVADEVLKQVGEKVREIVQDDGGIVCRREADTFLVYCPHRDDYSEILENASIEFGEEGKSRTRIRMRMGVYSEADKSIDIERRFDRAKLASDSVRSSFTKAIAIYDNAMHESEIFSEQLLEGFTEALEQKQFEVYYQPKFDIRPAEPVLSSAEALVRWRHPDLGMVSPGIFIPLFEKNGLVPELDAYVWREAAAQIRRWKDELGFCVPVSVNVSRVDMLDPELVEKQAALIREYGLDYSDLYLEITESAYTQDADQIIKTVSRLRKLGFTIEMDDFGSGYSSLNMISTLPIDALKLDMQFIRTAFNERKDTRMLEVVFDIAESLHVPTIAEGVETAEQLFTLKAMGCDYVQGYYFSRPVPAEEFRRFLLERKQLDDASRHPEDRAKRERASKEAQEKFTYEALHDKLTGMYNHSGFEMLYRDADKNHLAILVADILNYEKISQDQKEAVIRRVADVLRQSFRSVDLICRLKEEEFAVIMTRVNDSMSDLVCDKIEQINQILGVEKDGSLPVSLAVGAAFTDRFGAHGDILQDADVALEHRKSENQAGCEVYGVRK